MKITPHTRRGSVSGLLTICGALVCAAPFAMADPASGFIEGLREGEKVSLDVRARFEHNEIGATEVDGYSVRTRLGYTTGEHTGIQAMVEMEDLSFVEDDNRPALDLPTTELNQLWLSYRGAKLGRQISTLDDHRFIGHVGWRQNIQTFDALTTVFNPNEQSALSFAYLDAVHRVNATSEDLSGIVVNAKHSFSPALSLTGFAYLLDFDRPVLSSSDTSGFRGVGSRETDFATFGYSFSYARQTDNTGSLRDFDLDYLAGELSSKMGGFTLAVGAEFLEGNGRDGFTTPLATVHKFNGFADAFAAESLGLAVGLAQGLEDLYVTLGVKAGEVPISLSYHSFSTENISDFLGYEIDLVASCKLNDYVTFLTKIAEYRSDGAENVLYGGVDRRVISLEANLSY